MLGAAYCIEEIQTAFDISLGIAKVEACWRTSACGWDQEQLMVLIGVDQRAIMVRQPRRESDWRSKVHDGWRNICIASSDSSLVPRPSTCSVE